MWRGNSNSYFNTNNLTGDFYYNGSTPNIVRIGKVSPSSIHYSDFADQPDETTIGNFYDLTAIWAKDFNLTISKEYSSDSVTVTRTSSPIGRSTGSVSEGSNVISYGDKLTASVTQRSDTAYIREISPSSVTVSDNTTIETSTGAYKSGKVYLDNSNSHVTGQLYRSSSPHGASVGNISNGATIYWGDVITVNRSYTAGWSGGVVASIPRTYKPTNNGENLTLTMGPEFATAYSLYIYPHNYTSITVTRTSSPNGHAATGTLSDGANVYIGDKLTIRRTYTTSVTSGCPITVNGTTHSVYTSTVNFTVGAENVTVTTKYNYWIYNKSGYNIYTDGYGIGTGQSYNWSSNYSYITMNCDSAESVGIDGTPAPDYRSKNVKSGVHTTSLTKTNNTNYEQSYSISVNRNYDVNKDNIFFGAYWRIDSDNPAGSATLNSTTRYEATLTLQPHSTATVSHNDIRYLYLE